MNDWLNHVKAHAKTHNKFSLKAASATYKKGGSTTTNSGGRRRDSKGRYI